MALLVTTPVGLHKLLLVTFKPSGWPRVGLVSDDPQRLMTLESRWWVIELDSTHASFRTGGHMKNLEEYYPHLKTPAPRYLRATPIATILDCVPSLLRVYSACRHYAQDDTNGHFQQVINGSMKKNFIQSHGIPSIGVMSVPNRRHNPWSYAAHDAMSTSFSLPLPVGYRLSVLSNRPLLYILESSGNQS